MARPQIQHEVAAILIVSRAFQLPRDSQPTVLVLDGHATVGSITREVDRRIRGKQEAATPESGKPDDRLNTAIKDRFGSLAAMQKELTKAAESVFGSGWAWLIVDNDGKLQITSTPNQDNPLMKGIV